MPPKTKPVAVEWVPVGSPAMRPNGVASRASVVSIHGTNTHRMDDNLCELSVGLTAVETKRVDGLIANGITLRKHGTLYRAGDRFHALYVIQIGSLKTTVLDEDGHEQVAGYHMLGDIIGLDGIGTDHHGVEAIALDDAEVCALPFRAIENLARTLPGLQHNLHQIICRQITCDQSTMLLLGSMNASERLAVFLLNLADRYRCRGYSSIEYVLRMTREEIGSYLGLQLETVSRLFSRFQEEGLIQVQGRTVKLLDAGALKRVGGRPSRHIVQ